VAVTGLIADNPREKARLDLARKLGCDLVVEIGKQSLEDEIKSKFPKGVDRVIVGSPPESLDDAFKVIRFGGLVTFFGLHFGEKNKISLNVNDMIFRKITLRPTFAEPAINFPLSRHLLRVGLVDPSLIVTHTCRFDETPKIMGAIVHDSLPVIKAVVEPNS